MLTMDNAAYTIKALFALMALFGFVHTPAAGQLLPGPEIQQLVRTENEVTLTWTGVPNTSTTTIFRGLSADNLVELAVVEPGLNQYTDIDLEPGTYFYAVQGDGTEISTISSVIIPDLPPPAITAFYLVDAKATIDGGDSTQPVIIQELTGTVSDPDTINLTTLQETGRTTFNILVEIDGDISDVNAVDFELSLNRNSIELDSEGGERPIYVFLDTNDFPVEENLELGTYDLTAILQGANGVDLEDDRRRVVFNVVQTVTFSSLTLSSTLSAGTDFIEIEIEDDADGSTIELQTLTIPPEQFTLLAELTNLPDVSGLGLTASVLFEVQREGAVLYNESDNTAPYYLFDNSTTGNAFPPGSYTVTLSAESNYIVAEPKTFIFTIVDRIRVESYTLGTGQNVQDAGIPIDLGADTTSKSLSIDLDERNNPITGVAFLIERLFLENEGFKTVYADTLQPVAENEAYILTPPEFPRPGIYRLTTTPEINDSLAPDLSEQITFSFTGAVEISTINYTSGAADSPLLTDLTLLLPDLGLSEADLRQGNLETRLTGFTELIDAVQFTFYETENPSNSCNYVDTAFPFTVFEPGGCDPSLLNIETRYTLETEITPASSDPANTVTSLSLTNIGFIENVRIVDLLLFDTVDDTIAREIPLNGLDTLDLVDLALTEGFDLRRLNIRSIVNVPRQDPLIRGILYDFTPPVDLCFGEVPLTRDAFTLIDQPSTFCEGLYTITATPQSNRQDITLAPVSVSFTLLGPRIERFSLIDASNGNELIPSLDNATTINIAAQPELLDIGIIPLDIPDALINNVSYRFVQEGESFISRNNVSLPTTVWEEEGFWQNLEEGNYFLTIDYFVANIPKEASLDLIILDSNPTTGTSFCLKFPDRTCPTLSDNEIEMAPATGTAIPDSLSIEFSILEAGNVEFSRISIENISLELITGTDTVRVPVEGTDILIDGQDATLNVPLQEATGENNAYNQGAITIEVDRNYIGFNSPDTFRETFALRGPRIIGYSLLDTTSDSVLLELQQDALIDLGLFPDNLALRARLQDPGGTVSSLLFNDNLGIAPSAGIEVNENGEASFDFLNINQGTLQLSTLWRGKSQATSGIAGVDSLRLFLDRAPDILEVTDSAFVDPIDGVVRILIESNLFDIGQIADATVNYRFAGETTANFARVSLELMSSAQDFFQYAIDLSPFIDTSTRTIEYFIQAEDDRGFMASFPGADSVQSISVPIQGAGLVRPRVQPGVTDDEDRGAFRLISMPLQLDHPSVDSVLQDDLGVYDDTIWRLFDPHSRDEVSETARFQPGSTFWLITRSDVFDIDSGAGRTLATDAPFKITLREGWTFFGNPYNFPIPLRNLIKADSPDTGTQGLHIRTYDGEDWPMLSEEDSIEPFEGYAIENTAGADTLWIDPALRNRSGSEKAPSNNERKQEVSWEIQIQAAVQHARDSYNFASVAPEAQELWDTEDLAEPPVIGDFVSLYFPRPAWDVHTTKFSKDARPASQTGGYLWPFEVITSIPDQVTVSFDGLLALPREYEVFLLDPLLGISHNLKQDNQYTFRGAAKPRSFTLIVGLPAFIEEQHLGNELIPATHELHPNFPNPFSTTTTIRYGLPEADVVTLDIYNILGQRVALVEERQDKPAGYHAPVWNGRGFAGEELASGVYFARINTPSFSKTIKMVLIR